LDTSRSSSTVIAPSPDPAPQPGQRRGRRLGLRRVGGGALEPPVGRVQPPDHRVEPEELGVDDQGQAQVGLGFGFLDAGPLLHQLHQVAPVDLDHLVHVGAGYPQRHQHLHHQLVTRR
jgi:hypothetical protein